MAKLTFNIEYTDEENERVSGTCFYRDVLLSFKIPSDMILDDIHPMYLQFLSAVGYQVEKVKDALMID